MSHGNTEKCEPNLTPLLDLVLQLVMFFMLVANFAMKQTVAEITLPEAIAAKALDKGETDAIYLNVNKEGKVILTPDQRENETDTTLDNETQVQNYMNRRAAIEKRMTNKQEVQAVVILRVDRSTQFEKTYQIMRACRSAGYQKVQLRVIRSSEDR